jgi:hypothetical protein
MEKGMQIEFVLKLGRIGKVPDWYRDLFSQYRMLETEDRLIVDVPCDWRGFKDGTIIKLLDAFQESIYIALAYVSETGNVVVTDLEGKNVDRFDEVIDGKRCVKYVKKRLRVLKLLDEREEIFEVKGYLLNLQFPEPVVKVLDLYSVGKYSGIVLGQFVKGR